MALPGYGRIFGEPAPQLCFSLILNLALRIVRGRGRQGIAFLRFAQIRFNDRHFALRMGALQDQGRLRVGHTQRATYWSRSVMGITTKGTLKSAQTAPR